MLISPITDGHSAKDAVHAPVAHADESQREHEAGEPEQRDRPVGRLRREDRQRRDEQRRERRPDEVRALAELGRAGRRETGIPRRAAAPPPDRARSGSRQPASCPLARRRTFQPLRRRAGRRRASRAGHGGARSSPRPRQVRLPTRGLRASGRVRASKVSPNVGSPRSGVGRLSCVMSSVEAVLSRALRRAGAALLLAVAASDSRARHARSIPRTWSRRIRPLCIGLPTAGSGNLAWSFSIAEDGWASSVATERHRAGLALALRRVMLFHCCSSACRSGGPWRTRSRSRARGLHRHRIRLPWDAVGARTRGDRRRANLRGAHARRRGHRQPIRLSAAFHPPRDPAVVACRYGGRVDLVCVSRGLRLRLRSGSSGSGTGVSTSWPSCRPW